MGSCENRFNLEALEPRIMLAADANAGAIVTSVITDTISTDELNSIHQRSDNLRFQPVTGSISDLEEVKSDLDEAEEMVEVSKDSDSTSVEAQTKVDGDFTFSAKADENDLLLRLNPNNLNRLELLDQASGEVLLDQNLSEVESVSIFGSDRGNDGDTSG